MAHGRSLIIGFNIKITCSFGFGKLGESFARTFQNRSSRSISNLNWYFTSFFFLSLLAARERVESKSSCFGFSTQTLEKSPDLWEASQRSLIHPATHPGRQEGRWISTCLCNLSSVQDQVCFSYSLVTCQALLASCLTSGLRLNQQSSGMRCAYYAIMLAVAVMSVLDVVVAKDLDLMSVYRRERFIFRQLRFCSPFCAPT